MKTIKKRRNRKDCKFYGKILSNNCHCKENDTEGMGFCYCYKICKYFK